LPDQPGPGFSHERIAELHPPGRRIETTSPNAVARGFRNPDRLAITPVSAGGYSMEIQALGYMGVGAANIDEWSDFATG
jgi:hypothetical protein